MNTRMMQQKHWPHWLLWVSTALGVVWPLMHSVALRNSLLGILLLATLYLCRRQKLPPLPPHLQGALKIYLILSAWLLATTLLADDPRNALDQYRGEWLIASLAMVAGLLLTRLAINGKLNGLNNRYLLTSLILSLAIPCLLQIGYSLLILAKTHSLPIWDVPFFGRTSLSLVHNLLYGMLLADALSRSSGRARLLPLSTAWLMIAFGASFYCTYLLNTRNGTICVLLMTIFAALLAWYQHRDKIRNSLGIGIACLLLLAMGGFARLAYQAEYRWAAFGESTRIAWDTKHHKAWLDDRIPLPLMSNGQPVDHSAYMRLAWFKEGALAIMANPLGVGFGRNAYGHAMKRKYGIGSGHSHSSLIDFTLSGGIPGLLLWLAFSAYLLRLGWRTYFYHGDVVGMALLLLITGTLLRMVIDSNLRDHGLEQYLFLLAILTTMAADALNRSPTHTPGSLKQHAAH